MNFKIEHDLKEKELLEGKLEILESLKDHQEAYLSVLYKYHKLCAKLGMKPLPFKKLSDMEKDAFTKKL